MTSQRHRCRSWSGTWRLNPAWQPRTLRKDRDRKHSRLNIRLVRSNQLTFRSPRVRRQPRRRESSVSVTVSIAPGSNQVAPAITDELVRESAKLNPAPQPPKWPGRR
jgi:hypothetical protein